MTSRAITARVNRRHPGVAVAVRAARWAKPATGRSRGSFGGRRPGSGGSGATGREGRTPGSTSGGGNVAGAPARAEGLSGSGGTGRDGIGGTGREGRAPASGTGGSPERWPDGGVVEEGLDGA